MSEIKNEYYLRKDGNFEIENYSKKPAFSSFLPGIAGLKGIPLWCFYVNRGQCICSFGYGTKENSIMEFSPAYKSYRDVSLTGFRTFIKSGDKFFEPFGTNSSTKMTVGDNFLEITDRNDDAGLEIGVCYYILPKSKVGGLVRRVTVKNKSENLKLLQICDGMPEIIPAGASLEEFKKQGNTLAAWMRVSKLGGRACLFNIKTGTADSAEVTRNDDVNLFFTIDKNSRFMSDVADPRCIFGTDTSLKEPEIFIKEGISGVLSKNQRNESILPCAFFCDKFTLEEGQQKTFYSFFGRAENPKDAAFFVTSTANGEYFENRLAEAKQLVKKIIKPIKTGTALKSFDRYCDVTFLDNVLRGGMPLKNGGHNFYVFWRRHGDIERDYNSFFLSPEYWSQGSGNFRDVCQNRRSDNFFFPCIGDFNIKLFWNLLDPFGYNPLSVGQSLFYPDVKKAEEKHIPKEVIDYIHDGFTPGGLLMFMEKREIENPGEMLTSVMEISENHTQSEFKEGFWSDHWTYCLDLAEGYLNIYPDREDSLLFDDKDYYFYNTGYTVNHSDGRFKLSDGRVVMTDFLNKSSLDGKIYPTLQGRETRVNLIIKMISLVTNKVAALDPYGMGVMMEGGKPGWYDALNGLPALFGSSLCESCELLRLLDFVITALEKRCEGLKLPREILEFLQNISHCLAVDKPDENGSTVKWNKINSAKEQYKKSLSKGFSGDGEFISHEELTGILRHFRDIVEDGIMRAKSISPHGVIPSFLSFDVTDYSERDGVITPKNFEPHILPPFLEGTVRYLKTGINKKEAERVYENVKSSGLYDKKLKMYKVNDSLKDETYRIGRARAFTPGWLENQSIWLHMEYKYLLEILKSGLYEKFFEDAKNALIPFLKPEIYGRSNLENSSFIASSENPDTEIHGRGFVARLSGCTAEFLSMWQIMMFGKRLFSQKEDQLVFEISPAVPGYLLDTDNKIYCTLLGSISCTLAFDSRLDFSPDNSTVTGYSVKYDEYSCTTINDRQIIGKTAEDIRDRKIKSIEVWISRK